MAHHVVEGTAAPPAAKRLKSGHEGEPHPWTISARLMSGRLVATVEVPGGATSTIGQLRDCLRSATAMDGRMKLVYGGSDLSDATQTLKAAGVEDGAQVQLVRLMDRRVATANDSGTEVRFWNVDRAHRERLLLVDDGMGSADDADAAALDFSPLRGGSVGIAKRLDRVVAVPLMQSRWPGRPYSVRVWHVDRGWSSLALQGQLEHPWSIAVSWEGSVIMTCSREGEAKLWCASTGQCRATLDGFNRLILSLSLSPALSPESLRAAGPSQVDASTAPSPSAAGADAATAAEGGGDGLAPVLAATRSRDGRSVRIWRDSSADCSAPLELFGHRTPVRALVAAGGSVATCSQDGTAILWNLATGERNASLCAMDNEWAQVTCVAFSPSGRTVVTGFSDGSAQLWDADTGRPKLGIAAPAAAATVSVVATAPAPVGGSVGTAGGVGAEARGISRAMAQSDEVRCAAFSPDGELLALGFVWGATRISSFEGGRCEFLLSMDCSDGVIVFEGM